MRRRNFLSGVGLVSLSGCLWSNGGSPVQPSGANNAGDESRQCPHGGDRRPCLTVSHNPTKPTIGQSVVFDASDSYSPDGNTLYYFWRLGETTDTSLPPEAVYAAEGPKFAHRFNSKGRHTVEVIVTPENNVVQDADAFPHLEYGPGDADELTRASDVVEVQELREDPLEVERNDVNIHLKASSQSNPVGDPALLSFSVANLIGGPSLTAQLILQIPSNLTVNGTSFDEGGGQFTSTYSVAPGESKTDTLRIDAREPGPYLITGYVVYTVNTSGEETRKTEQSEIKLRFYE